MAATLAVVCTCLPLAAAPGTATPSPREQLSLDADWRFTKGDPSDVADKLAYAQARDWVTATGVEFALDSTNAAKARPEGNLGGEVAYVQKDFDDSKWQKINLPHDWAIEAPFKQEYPGSTGRLPFWGVGWYRKHLNLPAADQGRQLYLDIDGAMSYSMVWLNGQFVGGWPYGYASYRLDLTPYAKAGSDNVLAIRLDNPPASSRWYPGGGIYRHVWLVKTGPIHVAHWGTYVTTPDVTPAQARINLKVILENLSPTNADVMVGTRIYELGATTERDGAAVASAEPVRASIAAKATSTVTIKLTVPHPKLWSLERSNRYVAVTTVDQGAHELDSLDTPFGIRTLKFDPNAGFLLNGERVRFNGVCDHHDLGALGAAINETALERQLELLQEMGCNAIRTSHNPPAPELLDLCDRMGFLVMDEAFDCWVRRKTANDYHLLFPDWHEKDLRALIRRDRNHPCVIMWSIGNEVSEQSGAQGHRIAAELVKIVHEEDPTRPATAACNNNQAGFNGFQKILDVFGYNYKPGTYTRFHETNTTKFLFGSETASTVSSRGEYLFPVLRNQSDGKFGFQVSSYDLYAPPWATTPDTEFASQDKNHFVGGEFVWTGWDYLGEPTPYGGRNDPARSSYFGIIDLAGFKKDRFYLYQARWRPDFPMAHILPHWNWPKRVGQLVPVHVYTSGDEAELFLNGKSLGRKKKGPEQYRLVWDEFAYQPGELKVMAYRKGKPWAQATTRTTGPATKLTLHADRPTIKADGQDLSFITVTVADKDGLQVPRTDNHVQFTISGPGDIVATDNGDPTNLESFQAKQRNAFNGLCLVIVRSRLNSPGLITLTAQSPGLAEASVRVAGRLSQR